MRCGQHPRCTQQCGREAPEARAADVGRPTQQTEYCANFRDCAYVIHFHSVFRDCVFAYVRISHGTMPGLTHTHTHDEPLCWCMSHDTLPRTMLSVSTLGIVVAWHVPVRLFQPFLLNMASSASQSSGPEVHALLARWARPGVSLSDMEVRRAARLCEATKAFLEGRAHELIQKAKGSPVLVSYSSDGTPLSSRRRASAEWQKGQSVVRSGRGTDEFLVQHCFYRFLDHSGEAQTAVVLRDPLPLTKGKTALALFAAGGAFLRCPQSLGHSGIVVAHYAFDRAGFSALQRLLRQKHMLQNEADSEDNPLAGFLDWVVAHNSLKWGCTCSSRTHI